MIGEVGVGSGKQREGNVYKRENMGEMDCSVGGAIYPV